MFEQALDLAINNGIWAVLFVCLLVYLVKDSGKREERYVTLLNDLSERFCIVKKIDRQLNVVCSNMLEIKTFLFCKKGVA